MTIEGNERKDLGEFDQKGSVRTRYGTREEYLSGIKSAQEAWFTPLMILLRKDGYPCVFAADYYGAHYKDMGQEGNEHEI